MYASTEQTHTFTYEMHTLRKYGYMYHKLLTLPLIVLASRGGPDGELDSGLSPSALVSI